MSVQLPTTTVPMGQPAAPPMPTDLKLAKQARTYHRLRPERARSQGYHPSEVSKEAWCPVLKWFEEEAHDKLVTTDPQKIAEGFEFKKALLAAKKKQYSNVGTLKQEFVRGDEIHEMVQFLLGVTGKLRGIWQCAWCRATTSKPDWMPRTQIEDVKGEPMWDAAPCMSCRGRNLRRDISWLYVEPGIGWTAMARALGLDGHLDGELWEYRDGHWFRLVLEIKSINEYGYSEGKQPYWEDLALQEGWQPPAGYRHSMPHEKKMLPKEDHVGQASLYAAANDITHICFVYVNKNQVSQWKEFVVPLDPEALADARGRIEVVEEARRRLSGPPVHARICADVRDKMARDCPASERCFGCAAPEGGFSW